MKWFQEHFHISDEANLVEIGKLREFYLKHSGLDASSKKLMTSNKVFGKVVKKALPESEANQISIKYYQNH